MTNTKQGRPRKTTGSIRVQHMRESWRKASKKYYDHKKEHKKSKRKSKK